MEFIVKPPQQCTWNELDAFRSFLPKLWITSDSLIKRIGRCYLLGLCFDDSTLIWISAIKHPQGSWRHSIMEGTDIKLSSRRWEYGYAYVSSNYRWRGISKRLFALLQKKTDMPLYATVKIDNTPMLKILNGLGFIRKWDIFSNPETGDSLFVYVKPLKILLSQGNGI